MENAEQHILQMIHARDRMTRLAEEILLSLSLFHAGEQRADIEKIEEGCALFKQKLVEFLQKGSLEENLRSGEITSYLSKVRHDLRNSVNVINGYAEMILEEVPNPQAVEQFSAIIHQAGQILALVDTLKWLDAPEPAFFETEELPLQESLEIREFKKKFSILIVDDNQESCEILKRYLLRIGCQNIQMVHNGREALAALEKYHADLVLLDIDMPVMTGIETLQRLRDEIIQQKLMVLMISAVDTMENTIACIKLGAEDFLPKPFNADLLRVRIGSCIEKKWFINQEKIYLEQLVFEKKRYESLMKAVFPAVIVDELAETGTVKPAHYTDVAILFADVVSFTSYCTMHSPEEVLQNLQIFVEMCELAAIDHHLQKIKTIGDCFMASSGMLVLRDNPVRDCLQCAKSLLENSSKLPANWRLRIGIHYGSLIGGIVGHRQYQFDIWGDVVNTAARIQSQAEPNTICLSKEAWEKVQDVCQCRSLGMRTVRGKAPMEIFEYVSGG